MSNSIGMGSVPLPSDALVEKLLNLPILTSVPAVITLLFTMDKQIVCGWLKEISTPVSISVLNRYLDQCFKLIENIDDSEEFSMLRLNYENGKELVIIPNHEDGFVFCVVIEK